MIKNVLLFSLFLLSMSCSEQTGTAVEDSLPVAPVIDSAEHTEKVQVVPSDTIEVIDSTYEVEIAFWFTFAYCGGAPPNEEIIKEHEMLRKLKKSTLILRNHYSLKEYSCTTDANGVAKLKLESGKYDIYLTRDINPNLPTGFDPECKEWREKSMGIIKVIPERKSLSATIHFECNPCDLSIRMRP